MNRNAIVQTHESINDERATYRKLLLRIVFWALGLAACFGAGGVLFAGDERVWRVVGTCAATAVGALLMLGTSSQLDEERTWLPGVLAVWLIVTEYLATLGLIWHRFGSAQEPAAFTMLFLAVTAVPAIGCTALRKQPAGALSARVGLCVSAAVFALLMVGTWGGWAGEVRAERWHSLGGSLAIFGGLAVVCLVGSGTDQRHFRWLGVAAAGVAYAISAYAIIRQLHEPSAFFVCVVSVAAVVAHANAMAWCPLKPAQRWLLWGTIGAGIATGGLLDLARITHPWQEEMLGRCAGAAAIIAGCGTLALLTLARINQRNLQVAATVADTALAELSEITLSCPRCRARQTIAIGTGKCTRCGLIIQVQVQEPEPATEAQVAQRE